MSKTVRYLFAGCIAVVLLVGTFSAGLAIGWLLPHKNAVAGVSLEKNAPSAGTTPEASSSAPQNTDTLFAPFWEAWQLVHDEYVDQPVDDVALMRGAIRGMMAGLGDPHSSYMDPNEYRQANTSIEGSYEGIGAYVDTTAEYLTVTSPIAGSPAEKAGLRAGDQIIKVDGEDMTGIAGELVLQKVLGPAGSKVTLTIQRKGTDKPFDVTITRAKIVIKSVESKMLDNNIAYIKLSSFGQTTTDELKTSLKDLMAKKPKGMILDLRNNGGGYLETAIEVVSQFVPKGVVMYEQHGDGTKKAYQAIKGGLATDIPLVVLVNQGTASASEITAGAIQDYARGQLVGETTYGKGSVQIWTELQNDGGAVRVTVARWLTPKEHQINKKGLTPDVQITLTEDDFKAGKDPQLDKAVELLLQAK